MSNDREDLKVYINNLVCIVQEDLLVLDGKQRIVDASGSFFKTFDLDPDTSKGRSIYEVGDGEWDTPELHYLLEIELNNQETIYDYEIHQQFDERGKRYLHINACYIGKIINIGKVYMLTLRDETNAYNETEQLKDDIVELQDKNISLDSFAHTVAHDLKNPVSSLLGFASLLQRYIENMTQQEILESVDSIIDSGYHILQIIEATLMLTLLDRSIDIELETLDTHEMLERVEKTLSKMIREAQAVLIYPDVWYNARGYEPWVDLVWTNYISNAIKYGGTPPIVSLGCEKLDDGSVCFWVEDNGQGIPEDQYNTVFESFTRLYNGHSTAEGHGLGLAIVKKIMQKLNGEVFLESEVGKGSKFGFILQSQ